MPAKLKICVSSSEKTARNLIAEQENKRIQQIRKRASYRLFKELYDFLKAEPKTGDVLKKFHDVLDGRWCFGSRTNAACAAESIEPVLKDNLRN